MRYEPAIREEELEQTPLEKIIERLRTDKTLLFGIVAGLVIVILVVGITLILHYQSTQREQTAWFDFSRVVNKYKEGGILKKDANSDDYIQELSALLEQYPNSTATPYILYELGNQSYFRGELEEARNYYERIIKDFPNHYLANPDKLMGGTMPRAERDIGITEQEEAWLKENPNWLKSKDDFDKAMKGLDPSVSATVNTSNGAFEVKFYKNEAPKTVDLFLRLCKEGYYNNCKFFRLIPRSLIMCGDPEKKVEEKKKEEGSEEEKPKKEEVSFISEIEKPEHTHVVGTLAMAWNDDETKCGPVFYFSLAKQPGLDNKATIIGQVTSGLAVVKSLGLTKVDPINVQEPDNAFVPVTDIYITNIRISENGEKKETEDKKTEEKPNKEKE